MRSMGPRDPILATGLPLHGETQTGVAVEQNVGGLVGEKLHREMAELLATQTCTRPDRVSWAYERVWREWVVTGPLSACPSPVPGIHDTSPRSTKGKPQR